MRAHLAKLRISQSRRWRSWSICNGIDLERREKDTVSERTEKLPGLSGAKISGLSGAILAAGRGERLRDASGGIPKPLVELGGEALLVRQSRALAALGVSPVHAIINSETAAK